MSLALRRNRPTASGKHARDDRLRMTRMDGEATGAAPPERVWRVLTDASRMPEWFMGAKDVETADGWPDVGGRVRFRAGGGRFEARVVESKAPSLLVLEVDTPTARSRVTSRIEPAGAGARYQRSVDAQWKGMMGPLIGKLVIAPSVRREARKVVELAQS